MTAWKILVVDDEEGIHGITRMVFRDYEFEQRPIELISAMSRAEAESILQQQPDIALVLLDVVMETENAGLMLVDYIRNQLNNTDLRIILRTGHPGYAPEAQVIIRYDINDYLSKAELSASRLLTSVIVALRSYRDIQQARQQSAVTADSIGPSGTANAREAALSASHLFIDQQIQLIAAQLQQQMQPALQQSQRLRQMTLNPVATELVSDLHAHQLRLNNSIRLLNTRTGLASAEADQAPTLPSSLAPAALLDELLNIFLPQSRREGWLLDYQVAANVPEYLLVDATGFRSLLISAVELALRQAKGADLKLILQMTADEDQVQLSIKQSSGQPVYDYSPWAGYLRQQLEQLCLQMQGQFLEIEEEGILSCEVTPASTE